MEIRIGGYMVASFILGQEPQRWHTLVLLDSGKKHTDFVAAHASSHLYLRLDDIEALREGKQLPTAALVERGLEFARGKDNLLVTCRAGRGRSVAMAYVICCRERGVAEALKLLDPTRHRPNRLIVALGDALLGGPNILASFDDWRARHASVRLEDYYGEMEREFEALEAQGAVDRICVP